MIFKQCLCVVFFRNYLEIINQVNKVFRLLLCWEISFLEHARPRVSGGLMCAGLSGTAKIRCTESVCNNVLENLCVKSCLKFLVNCFFRFRMSNICCSLIL